MNENGRNVSVQFDQMCKFGCNCDELMSLQCVLSFFHENALFDSTEVNSGFRSRHWPENMDL